MSIVTGCLNSPRRRASALVALVALFTVAWVPPAPGQDPPTPERCLELAAQAHTKGVEYALRVAALTRCDAVGVGALLREWQAIPRDTGMARNLISSTGVLFAEPLLNTILRIALNSAAPDWDRKAAIAAATLYYSPDSFAALFPWDTGMTFGKGDYPRAIRKVGRPVPLPVVRQRIMEAIRTIAETPGDPLAEPARRIAYGLASHFGPP